MQKKHNLVSYKLKEKHLNYDKYKRLKRPEKQPGDLARVRFQPKKTTSMEKLKGTPEGCQEEDDNAQEIKHDLFVQRVQQIITSMTPQYTTSPGIHALV